MANKLTRKSLALGAGLALVATGLVATPASANAAITIAPDAGTSYDVFSNDNFALKVFGNASFNFVAGADGSGTDLQWEIEKDAALTVNVDDAAPYSAALTAGTGSTATKQWFNHVTSIVSTAGGNKLTVNPTSNTTFRTATVKVRAYIELDGSNGFTAGDLGSNQVTIRFLGSADIAPLAAVSVDPFKVGDTSQTVRATVTGINYDQANGANALKTVVYDNGAAQAEANLTANAAKTAFTASYTNTAATGDVIGAKLTALNFEDSGVQTDVAAATYRVVNQSTVTQITDFYSALSSSVRAATTSDYTNTTTATTDSEYGLAEYVVKRGTTSFTVSGIFKDATGKPIAGAPITVTVSEDGNANTVTNGAVVTSGGQSFTASATTGQSLTYTANTDANGLLSVTLTNSTAATDDRLVVELASSTTVKATAIVGWEPNGINRITVRSNPGFGVTQAVRGSTISATVAVIDDFEENWVDAAGTYRISTSLSGTSSQAVGEVAYTGTPVTISWTDSSASNGALTATFTLQKRGVSSWVTAQDNAPADIATKTAVYAIVSAAATAATITADTYLTDGSSAYTFGTTADQALELVAYADVISPTNKNWIKGTALTSTGAAAAGVPVTIAAPGVGFKSGGRYGVGSITTNTNANGAYEVEIYSNQAGTKTFTVTSGSASKTARIKYTDAAANTGASLVIDAPSFVSSGSTLTIKATLTDKFGNLVSTTDNTNSSTPDSSISYVGPGLLVGTTPKNATDGVMALGYLLGANDTGSIVVTARYDKNGDADYADFGDLVVTKTITIGTAPAAPSTGKVNVGSFNGKLVVYAQNLDGKRISWKVGGNWGKATAVGNTLNRFDRPTPRRGVTVSVQIYVDGVLQLTKSVVTR